MRPRNHQTVGKPSFSDDWTLFVMIPGYSGSKPRRNDMASELSAPYEHEVWQRMMRRIEGNPNIPGWATLDAFIRDVGRVPKGEKPVLCRKDTKLEFQRGNVEWRPTVWGAPEVELSPGDISRIRLDYASGAVTQTELAKRHGVPQSRINRVVRYQGKYALPPEGSTIRHHRPKK